MVKNSYLEQIGVVSSSSFWCVSRFYSIPWAMSADICECEGVLGR